MDKGVNTSLNESTGTTMNQTFASEDQLSSNCYFMIYNIMSFSSCLFLLLNSLVWVSGMIRCSNHYHDKLTNRVLFYPMAFFDTNPLGRVINRFSSDIQAVDSRINPILNHLFLSISWCVFLFIAIIFSQPWLVVLVPFLILYFFGLQRLYLPTARQLRRITSLSRSHFLAHFSEPQMGVDTIRAFSRQEQFLTNFHHHMDNFTKAVYPLHRICSWPSASMSLPQSFCYPVVYWPSMVVRQRRELSGFP